LTDSGLRREEADNLLVIKGLLGDALDQSGGTGLTVNVQMDDGPVVEHGALVASNGFFSTSIPLPADLDAETTIRARATWLGSSTSRGATSPILNLPVGGYAFSQGTEDDPEVAVFVQGQCSPSIASETEILQIVKEGEEAVLRDFTAQARPILQSKNDLTTTLSSLDGPQTTLVYMIGDCSGGSLLLPSGESISPEELGSSMPQSGNSLVIVEGPKSGFFFDNAAQFPEGTTLISSCQSTDSQNTLSPLNKNFSHWFFDDCKGEPVSTAFGWAAGKIFTFSPFGEWKQLPTAHEGTAWNQGVVLGGRFAPGVLPDLHAPEILDVSVSRSQEGRYELQVWIQDDRDTATTLQAEATALNLSGTSFTATLTPPTGEGGYHSAILDVTDSPGFLLQVVARDAAGNQAAPIQFWTATTDLMYDFDGSGQVDAKDLLECLEVQGKTAGTLYEEWLFEFTKQWEP